VAVSARRADALQAVVGTHPNALVLPFDAADAHAWPKAHSSLIEAWHGVDLCIFNAARYDPMRAWEIDLEAAEVGFSLNVLSAYRGLKLLLPNWLSAGQGRVALVASVAGYTGLPQATVYGATKAAVINLAESLYFDLAPRGIAVYLINPGFVRTPMTAVNDFAMPAILPPRKAADAIVDGIEAGHFEISFPKRFTRWVRLVSRLPYAMRFSLLHKATRL
jgi:short-subunit dehydrogenase